VWHAPDVTSDTGPAATSSTEITTWRLLRTERSFAWFIAGLTPGALVIGILGVTRTVLATDIYGDESGVASTAIASGLAGALAGLLVGALVDRGNARRVLLVSMALLAASQTALAVVYGAGQLTAAVLIALTIADGFLVGVQVTALLTTQAGLVSASARGAAEITNALRIGVGSAIGAWLATALLTPGGALILAAALTVFVTFVTAWTTRGFTPGHPAGGVGFGAVVAILRRPGPLRSTVFVNALLALVLPTQLVNFFIVDKALGHLLGPATIAGLVGVLAARLHLAATGLRGSPVRRVRLAYAIFAATVVASFLVLLVESDVVLGAAFAPLILVGSWSSTLAFGLVSATVQQRLPDDVRGRFTGSLNALLNVLAVAGVLVAGLIITPQSTEVFLLVLTGGLVAVAALTRGFAGLGGCGESEARR